MTFFYFSRKAEAIPATSRYLVSGVVEAETIDEARAALDTALLRAKTTDSNVSFDFLDLEEARKAVGAGLCAITIGG